MNDLRERRKVIRIKWIGEIKSDIGRRTALVLTCPLFLAYGIAAAFLKAALQAAVCVLVFAPIVIIRNARILIHSMCLRWSNAKPRGEDDWVVEAIDAYAERITAPKVAATFEVKPRD